MVKRKKIIYTLFYSLLFSVLFANYANAQTKKDDELAASYFEAREYDKAMDIYQNLFQKNQQSSFFYNQLLECYIHTEKWSDAEKMLRKQIRKNQFPQASTDLFYVYTQSKNQKKAEAIKKDIFESTPEQTSDAIEIAHGFIRRGEKKLAADYLLQMRQKYKVADLFAEELGNIMAALGNTDLMIQEYLKWLAADNSRMEAVQGLLQSFLQKASDFEVLKKALQQSIRDNPEEITNYDMLIWLYVQKKDFKNALVQCAALDVRLHANGRRIMALGAMAMENACYADAIKIFSEVEKKGAEKTVYYYEARMQILRAQKQLVYNADSVSNADVRNLLNLYTKRLSEQNAIHSVQLMKKDIADLYATFIHQIDSAILIYSEIIQSRDPDRRFIATCKLDCGDLYVLKGDVWEAMLLYGQVDKDFPEDPDGQEAKFRNARLSYYIGELDWARSQLDVLKTASTQLIANNALELSLLIQENTADSNDVPMQMFARADMNFIQHLYPIALQILDSIPILFPENTLKDDILFKKAQIYRDIKNYPLALTMYDSLITNFGDELYGDNAMFESAELCQTKMKNPSEAMSRYEKFIEKYPSSFFIDEARKRYRNLRGDILIEK